MIHDYGRHPYPVQLARSLANRGYDVLYLYSAAELPRSKAGKLPNDLSNIDIRGISFSKPYYKWSLIKRWFQEKEYGGVLANEINNFQPSLVISATTPLLAQEKALKLCKEKKIGFLFWVQDLQGIAIYSILRKRIPFFGALIGKYFLSLESEQLRGSDKIVLITEDFRPLIQKWVSDEKEIYTIPNWMPLDEIPIQLKSNEWAKQHDLDNKLCIIYTGVLGFKHKPDLIVNLALRLKENDDIRIVVVADGLGATWLREKKNELNIENLLILDFQPFELIPKILGTADILFGVLEPEASEYSVPSKISAYLCAGKPILYSMSKDNLAARIIVQNKAGIIVSPGDDQGFIDAAVSLVDDQNMRENFGRNARNYAEKHFDIELITDKFEKIINGSTVNLSSK